MGGVGIYAHHAETHPLDHDFSLYVQYRLANRSEYPSRPSSPPATANAIDKLLWAAIPDQRQVPSKQNLDDELTIRPTLRGPTVPHSRTIIEFSTGLYDDLTIPKSRPTKSQ
jgi:hypothetical protein